MKTMLVTGGAGFIGSNFIKRELENRNDLKIINFDKLTYAGNPNNFLELKKNPRYRFVKGDVCNKRQVESAMKKTDSVVHFAAETHVDRSINGARLFLKTDVVGTWVMLEAARKFKVKKFVQISTDEVYGSIESGKSNEDSALMPRNPYSASKAGADRLAYSYFATYGMPVVITRSSNNFGPNQFPEKAIPVFLTNLIQGKRIPLYGKGENIRDWVYVKDNCEAIGLLEENGRNGEVYNIGAGNEMKNIELVKAILKEFDCGNEMIEFVKDRPGHDLRYALDFSKITRETGWKPEHGFRQALRETIEWYRGNGWWWKPLLRKAKFGRFAK
ncbi:MAG: dTDP-glucose 4,6-dehydratase [archaeon]